MKVGKTKIENAVILLAGGSGRRMGHAVEDKVLARIAGKSLFERVLESFKQAEISNHYSVVYRDAEQRDALKRIAEHSQPGMQVSFVEGGKERLNSVYNALISLPQETFERVWIHDCARGLIHSESLKLLVDALRNSDAAVLAHRVKDSIKQQQSDGLLKDVPRERLWAMETPQCFAQESITQAYKAAINEGMAATDDVGIYERTGKPVALVENPYNNPKLTTEADLAYFEFSLKDRT
ncbi:MAG: 2-C-methyl-D-erythritol 4-phosphate cytidylyltransferase [Opitutales bacterium]|nr:2-C-methyl-D-erythritol 4-phosphate cytidylyltransferase [Opitutales bacterium]